MEGHKLFKINYLGITMKKALLVLVAAIAVLGSLSGCGAIGKQESAMEWMQRQPNTLDP